MRLKKGRCIANILIYSLCIFVIYCLVPKRPVRRAISYLTGYHAINKCNPLISPMKGKHPVIGWFHNIN